MSPLLTRTGALHKVNSIPGETCAAPMTDEHLDWWPLDRGGPLMREPPPDHRRIDPAEIDSLRTLIVEKNWTGDGTHLAILRRLYAARDGDDKHSVRVPTWPGSHSIKAGLPSWMRDRRYLLDGRHYVSTDIVKPLHYTSSLDDAVRLLESVLPRSHYSIRTDDDGAEAEIVTKGRGEGKTRGRSAPIALIGAILAVLIADPDRAAPRREP